MQDRVSARLTHSVRERCEPTAVFSLKGMAMIAVIFEVWPVEGRAKEYFDLAAELRPLLEKIDGFISIERFESLATRGKYLSLSFWRDEEAIRAWRNLAEHRVAQEKVASPRTRAGTAYSPTTAYGSRRSDATTA